VSLLARFDFPSRNYIFWLFLGLADYQYNPDPEDPVSKLRMAMEDLDGQYRNFWPLTSGTHLL